MNNYYEFQENLSESYLLNCYVIDFFEYQVDKFVVAISGELDYVQMFKRGKFGSICKIQHPCNFQYGAVQICKLGKYNYAAVRDKEYLTLIDLN